MHEQLVRIIEAELHKIDASSMAARQAVYERVRSTIARFHGGNTFKPEGIQISLALENVIETIEKRYDTHAGTRVERAIHGTMSTLAGFKSKYGAFAVAATTLSDFLKPIVELTQPVILLSAAGGAIFFVLRKFAGSFRPTMQSGAQFCAIMFLCSLSWWGLQRTVPGANANGAIAAVVPGATAVQNAVLASLGRIEHQTKRVGDILEDSALRDQRLREEAKQESERARLESERQQRDRLDQIRKKIADAGFSIDLKGMLSAIVAGFSHAHDFSQLGVTLNEKETYEFLGQMTDVSTIYNLWRHLLPNKDDHAFLRKLFAAMVSDAERLSQLFEGKNARAVVCDPKSYTVLIAPAALTKSCAQEGLAFASSYVTYFDRVYGLIGQGTGKLVSLGTPFKFSRKYPEDLPVIRVDGQLNLSRLTAEGGRCRYYEGNYSFFVGGGLLPFGAFEYPGTSSITYFEVLDLDFGRHRFGERCNFHDIAGNRRQCRARVIAAIACENHPASPTTQRIALIKILNAENPGAQTAAGTPATVAPQIAADPARAQPAQRPSDGGLTADEVRRTLLAKEVDHAGKLSFIYKSDGTFDAADGRVASNGKYRIEPDGRVCWQNSRGFSGCFQYYRKGNAIHVRRNDATSRDEIGPVKLTTR